MVPSLPRVLNLENLETPAMLLLRAVSKIRPAAQAAMMAVEAAALEFGGPACKRTHAITGEWSQDLDLQDNFKVTFFLVMLKQAVTMWREGDGKGEGEIEGEGDRG